MGNREQIRGNIARCFEARRAIVRIALHRETGHGPAPKMAGRGEAGGEGIAGLAVKQR